MTDIQIQQLSLQHVNDFRHIRLSALQNNPEMFASTYAIEVGKPLDIFLSVITENIVFAAYHDNNIIGMLIFHEIKNLVSKPTAHLYGFFVEPRFRGRGIATQILTTALHYGQNHVEQIKLSVVASNTHAIGLYKKLGFQHDSVKPHFIDSIQDPANEIMMVYRY